MVDDLDGFIDTRVDLFQRQAIDAGMLHGLIVERDPAECGLFDIHVLSHGAGQCCEFGDLDFLAMCLLGDELGFVDQDVGLALEFGVEAAVEDDPLVVGVKVFVVRPADDHAQ